VSAALAPAACRRESATALIVLALLALATRAWTFGNPAINIDEQFYLLVGERMLQGALPYVDIWDRKPIGLFLLYAFGSRLPPDAVTGYQLLAAASVTATAFVLFRFARRVTGFGAALAGAATYVVWLPVFLGIGGQSPVFYNLPMAAAALLTGVAVVRAETRWLTATGCLAMLLAGLALQIKYTAVFEGVFFGVSLLWTGWRGGRRPARLALDASLWIGCALAPTLTALLAYAAMGHGLAFVQANFLSVPGDANPLGPALARLAGLLAGLTPFAACLWLSRRRWRGPGLARWIVAWAGAALFGFLAFGVYFDHYLLPLLAPLALVAALAFDSVARPALSIALVAGLGLVAGQVRARLDVAANGTAQEIAALAALVRPQLAGGGCLYVNEAHPALYRATDSCLPTRFPFPQHLALRRYREGLGVDQLAELRRLLAAQPAAIVVSTTPDDDTRPAARAVLLATLARDYRPLGTRRVGDADFTVYGLARVP
jgi:hypothetical protein